MKDDASSRQIEEFLNILRSFASISDGIKFYDRRKNLNSMARWGIGIAERKEIVKNLNVNNYFSGPDEEKDNNFPPGDIWVFKKRIRSAIFYIKFKLEKNESGSILKCLSFHEDEF